VLERLDRLERENRELAAEVAALRARIDGPASAVAGAELRPVEVPLEHTRQVRRLCAGKKRPGQGGEAAQLTESWH
jgi:hypothetical protein